jgi:3-oxoacyl-[acyl-carrier protein] reductase
LSAAAQNDRPLAGQVAVVTGGGRGIGRAIAIRFAAAGASVMVAARTRDDLDETVRTIRAEDGDAEAFVADVRDPHAVDRLIQHTAAAFGRIDIALLGAGISAPSIPVEEVPTELWREMMDTNLNGVFYGLRAVVPHLREAGGGKIIVLGSAAARRATAGLAPYAVSKTALTGLVRVAARELREARIAINELQPGPTATALHGVAEDDPDTLADRGVVLEEGLETDHTIEGEWFKSPRNVAEFALYIATLPNYGPSGQIFSYNSAV